MQLMCLEICNWTLNVNAQLYHIALGGYPAMWYMGDDRMDNFLLVQMYVFYNDVIE